METHIMTDRDKLEAQISDAQGTLADIDHALECEPPPYPWTESLSEDRRSFVFEHMADSQLDVFILLDNMQRCYDWLASGEVPKKPDDKKRHLKVAGD